MYTCSIKCFCVPHPEVVTGPIHEHSLNHVFQPVIKQAHQTLPSLCVILKAICARVGWVWLARLKAGPEVILCSMSLHYSACAEQKVLVRNSENWHRQWTIIETFIEWSFRYATIIYLLTLIGWWRRNTVVMTSCTLRCSSFCLGPSWWRRSCCSCGGRTTPDRTR